jgi:hypothetical protein
MLVECQSARLPIEVQNEEAVDVEAFWQSFFERLIASPANRQCAYA